MCLTIKNAIVYREDPLARLTLTDREASQDKIFEQHAIEDPTGDKIRTTSCPECHSMSGGTERFGRERLR